MFEKIVLRRSEAGPALTVGEIAEALLFYQNVHIVMDYGSLLGLVRTIGTSGVMQVLSRPHVSAVYSEEMLGARTVTVGSRLVHCFVAFKITGDQTVGPLETRQRRLEHALTAKSGVSKDDSTRFAKQFLRRVPAHDFTSNHFITGGAVQSATADMNDSQYVLAAMRRILRQKPGFEFLADNLTVDVIRNPLGTATGAGEFLTWSNLDQLNAQRRTVDSGAAEVTEAGLVVHLLDASTDLALAAHYGGDFYTSTITSDVIRIRHAELLRRSGISAQDLQTFKDVALPNFPSVAEVINSGERTLDDFLKLLDKSDRFRSWVRSVTSDEKLAAQYVRDVTAEGWAASLPVKLARYVIGTGVGLVNPIAGAAISAGDSLLLDKLAKGWQPSHFVQGHLKPFVDVK